MTQNLQIYCVVKRERSVPGMELFPVISEPLLRLQESAQRDGPQRELLRVHC